MFELMATGTHSHLTLSDQLYREGLRNRNGNKCGKSAIAFFLHNSIYYGVFRWKGRMIQGSHPPLITKELFDKAQAVMSGKSIIHTHRKGFAFNNLMLCGICGCKVLGETKKGRYNYYHCTFSKGRHHGKVYLREEKLSELFEAPVKAVTLDAEIADWLTDALREESKGTAELQEKRLAVLKTNQEKINNRISALFDAKFDKTITEETFIAKEKEYQSQLIEIKTQMAGLKRTNPNYLQDATRTLELSKRLHPLYVRSNYQEKAQILQLLASNYTLVDVTPVPKWRKPFDLMAKGLSRSEWLLESYSETTVF